MKRILILTLIIMMLLSIFSIFPKTAFGDVEITGVEVNPNELDKPAEFKIFFNPHTVIGANGTIGIKFPTECTLPDTIPVNYVNISHYTYSQSPINVQVIKNQNLVVLTIPSAILAYEPTVITFYLAANIITPQLPSSYTINMWTSSELTPVPYPFTVGSSSGNKVSSLQVTVFPLDGGANAEYSLLFNVTQEGALIGQNNDYVDVYFSRGTTFPTKIDPSKVLLRYNQCERIEIDKQRVRVYLPSSLGFIAPGVQCNILFLKDFGIKNPLIPRYYSVQVATSKDIGIAVSNSFPIVGTQISSATLSVDPLNQLSPTKYTIKFKTSPTKKLVENTDQIFVEFPKEVTLPSNIIPGAVLVNDTPCLNVSLSSQTLQITTPINIYENSDVNVTINTNFGIKNPSSTGDYSIKIYTMTDSMPVGLSFTVTSSTISKPEVVLSSTSAGQISVYNISFTTGVSGNLLPGIDRVNVILPIGTTIPSLIPTSTIIVNGVPTTLIKISGTTLTITLPVEIKANEVVNISITEGAGIRNPVQSGNYVLYVFTTKEQTSVSSNLYSIKNVPQTTLKISPEMPDGLNGFYRTQPSISFTATSATDSNPTIYYYFDGNSLSTFTGIAIVAPEGIHTLYYYAVDHQGHQEASKSMQFKVDTVPPQLIVLTPVDNAVLNSKDIAVSGTVDVGATVKVNGQAASVDSAGHFSATVHITENGAVINITSVDSAGNSIQKILHVSLDTTPPALTVTAPVPFQEIHKLPVTVSGTTEPGMTVTVDENAATVDEDGNFTYALATLKEGEVSIIEVIAKDTAGNETKKDINVKYIRTTIIKLQINNAVALINTDTVSLDAPPVIKDGRTLVPLRFVSEAFGAKLDWDPVFQIIDITLGSDKIRLQIGKNIAFVNGKEIKLDVAPYIVNGRTLVPIRFISETFGAEVVWDDATKTVTIIYPKP